MRDLLFVLLIGIVKVTGANLTWALASLESILEIFAFLKTSQETDLSSTEEASAPEKKTANESYLLLQNTLFTHSHAEQFLQILLTCEQVMVISEDQCPVKVPASLYSFKDRIPKRSDPLESIYRIDPVPVQSHSRIVRLGLDLVSQQQQLQQQQQQQQPSSASSSQKDIILSRALCYRIQEAIEMARLGENTIN